MEVYVSIFEVLLATHCILAKQQEKAEPPESRQLLHRNIKIATGIPSFAKLTIVKFPFGRYVPTPRSDSILLRFRWILGPNCVVFAVFGVRFVVLGDQKLPP